MKSTKFVTRGTLGLAAMLLATGLPQPGIAETITLQCSQQGEGFEITAVTSTITVPILTVSDLQDIRQTCSQVATRLQRAITSGGVEDLMIVAHSIGRRDSICVVRSSEEGCRSNNLLLDVPRGKDRDEFLTEILSLPTETFLAGTEGQHTRRRQYSKFGAALSRNTK